MDVEIAEGARVPPVVNEFCSALAERLGREPDLEHFLCWWGGTLEYWIEIVAAGIGRQFGWTAHSEIPYITGCPSPSSKTNVKWADGVLVTDDGLGVLLEIKTVPMKAKLGGAIEQVPKDLAALLAIDWPLTTTYKPPGADEYTDPKWWDIRTSIRELWGINIALVHGVTELASAGALIDAGVNKGIASLQTRFGQPAPAWMPRLVEVSRKPIFGCDLQDGSSFGQLFVWAGALIDAKGRG